MIRPNSQNVARTGGSGGTDASTIDGSVEPTFFGGPHPDPVAFRATGRGLNIKHPSFSANTQPGRAGANACLEQTDGLRKLYLFVDRVRSSWNVEGSYGQANLSRTFYPHSFVQQAWVIEGQMANQYEYDLLVEFVEYHQRHLLTNNAWLADQPVQVIGADFLLFSPQNNTQGYRVIPDTPPHPLTQGEFVGRKDYNKFFVTVAITNIQAGHERFQFAPAFTLTCMVLWDHWRDSGYVSFDIWDYFANPLAFLQGVPLTGGPAGLHPPEQAPVNQPSNIKPSPPNSNPGHGGV